MTIRFTGRTRAETKRKALGYWVDNQDRLQISMRDFLARCTMSPDGTTIVFASEQPQPRLWLLRRAAT